MQKTIRIQCPAKINLNLKVTGKRSDGFHNIDSVMQTINLFDYLTITVEENSCGNKIILSGNSDEIPYNEKNLVCKATELFLFQTGLKDFTFNIYIEKNIPVAAGLAGGSTDAAGTIYGLNKLFDDCLSEGQLHQLCAKLGSDLNVCLQGGRIRATGRGEIIENLPFENFKVSLIKPMNLGISAKEAYTKFSLKTTDETKNDFVNDLEWAIIDDYKELKYIKSTYPNSVMTGSGSTFFAVNSIFKIQANYWVKNELRAIPYGVAVV